MMLSRVRTVPHDELKSLVAAHPLRSLGYDFDVPVLPGAMSPPIPAPALSITRPAMARTISN